MPRPIPPPLSLALTHLRTVRGWTQNELAAAFGLSGKTISEFETGSRQTLSRERLERLICAPWKGGAFQWVRNPPGSWSLRPVAIGAVVEETKPSEPPM